MWLIDLDDAFSVVADLLYGISNVPTWIRDSE